MKIQYEDIPNPLVYAAACATQIAFIPRVFERTKWPPLPQSSEV